MKASLPSRPEKGRFDPRDRELDAGTRTDAIPEPHLMGRDHLPVLGEPVAPG